MSLFELFVLLFALFCFLFSRFLTFWILVGFLLDCRCCCSLALASSFSFFVVVWFVVGVFMLVVDVLRVDVSFGFELFFCFRVEFVFEGRWLRKPTF